MVIHMKQQVSDFALGPPEIVFMVYRWIANNIYFDFYNNEHNPNYSPYLAYDVFSKGYGAERGITICLMLCSMAFIFLMSLSKDGQKLNLWFKEHYQKIL